MNATYAPRRAEPPETPWDVVTGASGFIGARLVDRLLMTGRRVVGIDQARDRSATNRDRARYRFVQADLTSEPGVELQFHQLGVLRAGTVFHLAAVVGVVEAAQKAGVVEDMTAMTSAALALGNHLGSSQIVYFSSSEVYGEPAVVPTPETAPLAPLSEYAKGKVASEELVLRERDAGSVVIVRPFGVFGPGQTKGVIPAFVRRAREGVNLEVVGDGSQVRTFVHVDDLLDQLLAVEGSHQAHGAVFNLGGSSPISMSELATAVIRAASSTSSITYVDAKAMGRSGATEIRVRQPNIDRVRALGVEPTRDLEDSLVDVVAHQVGVLSRGATY